MTIFALQGTAAQDRIILDALARCDFPWEHCRDGLRRISGGSDFVPVTWRDLSAYGARAAGVDGDHHIHQGNATGHVLMSRGAVLGLFWTNGRIEIGNQLENNPPLAHEVFLSEAAHAVDYCFLSNEQRQAIYLAYHGGSSSAHGHPPWWEDDDPTTDDSYWNLTGEAFMAGFTAAFSDLQPTLTSFTHKTTLDIARRVREIVLGSDRRYFATTGSRVFHDTHKGRQADLWFSTAAEAIASGRRPCRICKP